MVMQAPCLLNADALSSIVANGGLALPISYLENALTPPPKISAASLGKAMGTWQMQTAKARLAEVVKDAQQSGPQEITVHGRPVAVVLSRTDYDRLVETGESLPDFMRRSPLAEAEDIEFPRDRSPGREVPL